jgi:Tol biopolymer transport system component
MNDRPIEDRLSQAFGTDMNPAERSWLDGRVRTALTTALLVPPSRKRLAGSLLLVGVLLVLAPAVLAVGAGLLPLRTSPDASVAPSHLPTRTAAASVTPSHAAGELSLTLYAHLEGTVNSTKPFSETQWFAMARNGTVDPSRAIGFDFDGVGCFNVVTGDELGRYDRNPSDSAAGRTRLITTVDQSSLVVWVDVTEAGSLTQGTGVPGWWVGPPQDCGAAASTHLVAYSTPDFNGSDLSIANEDGSDPHVIFRGGFLSWSPSGQYVLATAPHGEAVIDLTGQTIGTLPYGSASWGPDDHIVVTARLGNGAPSNRMALYDVRGALVRTYPTPDGIDMFAGASWAPDGRSFVTEGCEGCSLDSPNRGWGLWVMAADGSGASKIADLPRGPAAGPQWSPDGTSISYSTACLTAHEQCKDAEYGAWLIGSDGRNPHLLVRHGGSLLWSPDGSRLVYSQRGTQGESLFVSLADGSHPIQLTNEPDLDYAPRWISPDRIGYVHRGQTGFHGTILATRADGTQVEPDLIGRDWTSFGWQP